MLKSGLLYVAEDRGCEARVEAATKVSQAFGMHLTCVQAAPFPAYGISDIGGTFSYNGLLEQYEKKQAQTKEKVASILDNNNIDSRWFYTPGSASSAVVDYSRLSDLIILSHLEGDKGNWDQDLELISEIAVHARAPILSMPYEDPYGIGQLKLDGGSIIVAWNGTFESAQALRFAVPVLSKASRVQIATIGLETVPFPATEAQAYLTRHGVTSQVLSIAKEDREVEEQLLNVIIDEQADLAVLGAYGHSRMRERLLGGVTRFLLSRCPKPLLLAH